VSFPIVKGMPRSNVVEEKSPLNIKEMHRSNGVEDKSPPNVKVE
jgi:hypothetical protein